MNRKSTRMYLQEKKYEIIFKHIKVNVSEVKIKGNEMGWYIW